MKELLIKYGGLYAIAGAIGAVVLRFKKKMSLKTFIGVVVFASFTGWVGGMSMEHYLELPQGVMYAFCSVLGVFSDELYKEFSEIVSTLSEKVSKLIDKLI